MSADARVVQLPASGPGAPRLKSAPDRRSPKCDHRTPLVDIQARTLTCEKCGAALDALAWLDKLARQNEVAKKEQAVHAAGRDGNLTLCGTGRSGWIDDRRGRRPAGSVTFSLQVTNRRLWVTCKRCRHLLLSNEETR